MQNKTENQKTSSFTDNELCFIETIVDMADTLSIIKKLAEHTQRLISDGADEQRLIGILSEMKNLCCDGQETVAGTGLSWK